MNSDQTKFSKQQLLLAVEKIQTQIEKGEFPNNKKLIEICAEQNINLIENLSEPHLIHEILETAVNRHLLNTYNAESMNSEKKFEILAELEDLTKNLPPQSWRGQDQITYQQFSTPPPLGFVMAQMLKPQKGMTALEPSAGTGCLALWLKIAGCTIFVNEISERRRELLEMLDFAPTRADAEFLDELLPDDIKPDLILMNPPFSASGGRVKNADSNFGFRHVKSALTRLNENGRLVALLGSDALLKSGKGCKFLDEIRTEYSLKAVFTLPKTAFYKYGTNFQTVVVCIEKRDLTSGENQFQRVREASLEINCRSLEECLSFSDVFE